MASKSMTDEVTNVKRDSRLLQASSPSPGCFVSLFHWLRPPLCSWAAASDSVSYLKLDTTLDGDDTLGALANMFG